jgi:hypothetical protein
MTKVLMGAWRSHQFPPDGIGAPGIPARSRSMDVI